MTGETWAELFQALIYGDGAIIGLILVAVLGVIAISKMRGSGVIFMLVSGMMCIMVLDSAGNNLQILTAAGYGFLIVFFLVAMLLNRKGGVF